MLKKKLKNRNTQRLIFSRETCLKLAQFRGKTAELATLVVAPYRSNILKHSSCNARYFYPFVIVRKTHATRSNGKTSVFKMVVVVLDWLPDL